MIDVHCLHAFRQSCATYQPAYLGARDDALVEERVVDQLKFKPQGETVRRELSPNGDKPGPLPCKLREASVALRPHEGVRSEGK